MWATLTHLKDKDQWKLSFTFGKYSHNFSILSHHFGKLSVPRVHKLLSDCNKIQTHNLLDCYQRTFTPSFVNEHSLIIYKLNGCGFESCCCHLNSDMAPPSSKEFLDIQANSISRFTLNLLHDMKNIVT